MEKNVKAMNGYLALLFSLVLFVAAITFFVMGSENGEWAILGALCIVTMVFLLKGLMVIHPNHIRVLNFFGKYVGTVKANGLFFVNPLYSTIKLTQRAQNLATPTLKVNDKMGNPIEIGAVVVWKVDDSYKAAYEVSDYLEFVTTQSEAAVRNLANGFAYDNIEDEDAKITLRDGGDQVNTLLEKELSDRLASAGITILEARISHLAYAQEIAGAMLQRQQATAIVAARYKIVEGAVGMVEMALDELNKKDIVNLDEEKKASMVSNLLVVLCGEKSSQPVINAGTLY